MNVTDIEDKIIRDSIAQGIKYTELTDKYEKIFLENLADLNIEPVEVMPHPTDPEVIAKMIEIISDLIDKGCAYKSEDGSVYFSINKFKTYGKLSGLDKRTVMSGARVSQDEYDKENAQDFAIWKAEKTGEPSWPAPFGNGRPGWHIECTAMSIMNLGETIDIHGGGIDLVFPHHENEIALSEAYTGKQFVKLWFHGEFLMVNGQKMSKSLKNIYSLDDIKEKYAASAMDFRMLCLNSYYREKLNFTDDSIIQAKNTLSNIKDFIIRLKEINKDTSAHQAEVDEAIELAEKNFKSSLSDDLNMPKALASIFGFIKIMNKFITQGISKVEAKEAINFMLDCDKVLGLELDKVGVTIVNEEVQSLLLLRETARTANNWDESDRLRNQIVSLGYEVEDTTEGQKIKGI